MEKNNKVFEEIKKEAYAKICEKYSKITCKTKDEYYAIQQEAFNKYNKIVNEFVFTNEPVKVYSIMFIENIIDMGEFIEAFYKTAIEEIRGKGWEGWICVQ